jgi:hypothetical protein
MTPKKIAEWIVEHKTCRGYYFGVSCTGMDCGVNAGTPCPLLEGDFDCDGYDSPLQAAQAWLEANGEDV